MNATKTIPRIIHYCWFGGKPLNDQALRCIESWSLYCPNFKIVRWDENNFDVSCCDYAREAYEAGKWAFVSDVARLHALAEYGGIYMDTDVELLKPIDDLLECAAVIGFETDNTLQTAFMACKKHYWLIDELLKEYSFSHFVRPDGSFDQKPNVVRLTRKCMEHGLECNGEKQTIGDMVVFSQEYFSPKNYKTGVLAVTSNTYAIHHFDASWYTQKQLAWLDFERKVRRSYWNRLADSTVFRGIKKIYVHGFGSFCRTVLKKIRE